MTFLSPIFMFIFLPIALIGYAIVPKYRKTDVLPAIGMVFFVCLNVNKPLSLIPLTVLVFSVIAATGIYKKNKNRLVLEIFRSIVLLVAIAILVLRMFKPFSFVYSVGMVMCLMAAASLCTDILRGEGRVPSGLWDGAVYVTYFPIMQAGPFIKYGDFVEKFDKIHFGTKYFSSGVWLFLCGSIKCIAVGAVMMNAHGVLFAAARESGGVAVAFFLAAVYFVAVYASFSGYSDMGRGISYMLGISLPEDLKDPFRNSTPAEFIRNFFRSLSVFYRSCIGDAIVGNGSGGIFGKLLIATVSAMFTLLLFCRSSDAMAFLFPLTVAAMYFALFSNRDEKKKKNIFLRIGGCIITFVFMTSVWAVVRCESPGELSEYAREVFSNPLLASDYEFRYRLGNPEYYAVPFAGGVLSAFGKYIMKRDLAMHKDSVLFIVVKSVTAIALLAMFILCIIFLLPRFPGLSVSVPGKGLL